MICMYLIKYSNNCFWYLREKISPRQYFFSAYTWKCFDIRYRSSEPVTSLEHPPHRVENGMKTLASSQIKICNAWKITNALKRYCCPYWGKYKLKQLIPFFFFFLLLRSTFKGFPVLAEKRENVFLIYYWREYKLIQPFL